MVGVALVGILLGGAATASNSAFGDSPEQVGICHATGSAENPYVFLLVKEDGYEHGHHRHHEADFFVAPESGGCVGDEYVPPYAGNETDDNDTAAPDNETDSGADDNATAGNETDDGMDDNATIDNGTADNETDGADDNNTADNETMEPAPGDASISQVASQDEHRVVFDIVVTNVGESPLGDVSAGEDLPDVRRPWLLTGEDASACTLTDDSLYCWFGELAPGESRTVSLSAYTDRLPCGESMNSTAWVNAADDPESRNDSSSAGVEARYC